MHFCYTKYLKRICILITSAEQNEIKQTIQIYKLWVSAMTLNLSGETNR